MSTSKTTADRITETLKFEREEDGIVHVSFAMPDIELPATDDDWNDLLHNLPPKVYDRIIDEVQVAAEIHHDIGLCWVDDLYQYLDWKTAHFNPLNGDVYINFKLYFKFDDKFWEMICDRCDRHFNDDPRFLCEEDPRHVRCGGPYVFEEPCEPEDMPGYPY
ncbi:MAG: hypothetical protein JW984_15105 [Deltaproteobacteria bacterium]|uniref:Uncharacterized protein n=1 Tax=Candidatus Zymogenus saltonus TaxID=2844893 RepID=A0A9D8KHH1_9DELT|nr:hypothetical protein [Candidatus Zymogenus saltonus]